VFAAVAIIVPRLAQARRSGPAGSHFGATAPSSAFQDEIYVMRADGSAQTNITNARTNEGMAIMAGRRSTTTVRMPRMTPEDAPDLYMMRSEGSSSNLIGLSIGSSTRSTCSAAQA
jgi:hypothetical protein